jgi:hypothetical protein
VPLPADTPVPDVSMHMKCPARGSRKINKPRLYHAVWSDGRGRI